MEQNKEPMPQYADLIKDIRVVQSYDLIDALVDTFIALKKNTAAVTLAAFLMIAPMAFFTGIATIALHRVPSDDPSASISAVASVVVVALILMSFTLPLVGLAVRDGINGTKTRLGGLLLDSARRAPRVLLAEIAFLVVVLSPLMVGAVVATVLSALYPDLFIASIAIIAFSLVACIPLFIRYALLPTVAIFERSTSPLRFRSRLRQLLGVTGKGFIAKYLILMVLANLFLPGTDRLEGASVLVVAGSALLSTLFYFFTSSMLVAFYHNRQALES